MMAFGYLSSRGDFWDRLARASANGFFGSTAGMLSWALVHYLKLRLELRRLLKNRCRLTDQEFIDLSPRLKGVDPALVSVVRGAVATKFRGLGGELFHPDDNFAAHLNLADLTFSLGEELEIVALTLAETFGFDEKEFEAELGCAPIQSYADLIKFLDRFWRRSTMNPKVGSLDRVWDHPLADTVLDGQALLGAARR
jgi:hypothetical protein